MHIVLHVRIQLLGAKIYEKCFTVKVEKSRDYCRASSVRMAFIPRHVGAAVAVRSCQNHQGRFVKRFENKYFPIPRWSEKLMHFLFTVNLSFIVIMAQYN